MKELEKELKEARDELRRIRKERNSAATNATAAAAAASTASSAAAAVAANRELEEAKKEFASQLEETRKDGEAKESAEAVALREANENLKVLLSGAEKKYMRISSLNMELQKKVDTLEQKSRMSLENV